MERMWNAEREQIIPSGRHNVSRDLYDSVVAAGAHEKPALSLEGDSCYRVVQENMYT